MNTRYWLPIIFLLLGVAVLVFPGCAEESQEAELLISDEKFTIVQEGKHLHSVKVTGTIRNTGNVDVSDLIVTGECPSCYGSLRAGDWFLTDHQKADAQSDVIRFLGKAERHSFEFQGLAYYSTGGGYEPPAELPEELHVRVDDYKIDD